MKKLITLFCSLFIGFQLFAQVSIVEDPGIGSLLQRNRDINFSTEEVVGWRVQILATTDREKVMKTKTEFLRKFPQIKTDWDYVAPYYKLKAGAYLYKLEAANLRHRILGDYPNAYVTKDAKVKPADL